MNGALGQEEGRNKGHCRCGAVAVAFDHSPEFSVYCHCDDCRRATGAPVLASIGVPKAKVHWTGTPTRYNAGTATRLFCATCGSPVAQEHESRRDMIFFNTGFMDKPQDFPPMAHTFAGQQLSWLTLQDDLPRYEKTLLIATD